MIRPKPSSEMHTSLVAEVLAMALVSGDLKSGQDHQEQSVLAKKLERIQVPLETSSETSRNSTTMERYRGRTCWFKLV